jgi:hypothetical protein
MEKDNTQQNLSCMIRGYAQEGSECGEECTLSHRAARQPISTVLSTVFRRHVHKPTTSPVIGLSPYYPLMLGLATGGWYGRQQIRPCFVLHRHHLQHRSEHTQQTMRARNLAARNLKARNLKARNLAARNLKARNLKARNLKARNLKAKNLKARDLALEGLFDSGLQNLD